MGLLGERFMLHQIPHPTNQRNSQTVNSLFFPALPFHSISFQFQNMKPFYRTFQINHNVVLCFRRVVCSGFIIMLLQRFMLFADSERKFIPATPIQPHRPQQWQWPARCFRYMCEWLIKLLLLMTCNAEIIGWIQNKHLFMSTRLNLYLNIIGRSLRESRNILSKYLPFIRRHLFVFDACQMATTDELKALIIVCLRVWCFSSKSIGNRDSADGGKGKGRGRRWPIDDQHQHNTIK